MRLSAEAAVDRKQRGALSRPTARVLVAKGSEMLPSRTDFDDLIDTLVLGNVKVILLCNGRRDKSIHHQHTFETTTFRLGTPLPSTNKVPPGEVLY